MIYASKEDIESCKIIILDELKKRDLSKLNSIVDKLVEDVMNVVYSKGGDYSVKTIKSFAETYFDVEMYKKFQVEK